MLMYRKKHADNDHIIPRLASQTKYDKQELSLNFKLQVDTL